MQFSFISMALAEENVPVNCTPDHTCIVFIQTRLCTLCVEIYRNKYTDRDSSKFFFGGGEWLSKTAFQEPPLEDPLTYKCTAFQLGGENKNMTGSSFKPSQHMTMGLESQHERQTMLGGTGAFKV